MRKVMAKWNKNKCFVIYELRSEREIYIFHFFFANIGWRCTMRLRLNRVDTSESIAVHDMAKSNKSKPSTGFVVGLFIAHM